MPPPKRPSDDELAVEPPGLYASMSREEKYDEFLRQLSQGNSVRQAAASVGVSYHTMYSLRRNNAEFAKRWEEACKISIPRLETEAFRRAMAGSDRMLMFVLERRAPHLYGARQSIDHTSSDGSMSPAPQSDDERIAKVEALLAVAKARRDSKASVESSFDDLI
jgi:hypothetical protein